VKFVTWSLIAWAQIPDPAVGLRKTGRRTKRSRRIRGRKQKDDETGS